MKKRQVSRLTSLISNSFSSGIVAIEEHESERQPVVNNINYLAARWGLRHLVDEALAEDRCLRVEALPWTTLLRLREGLEAASELAELDCDLDAAGFAPRRYSRGG